jgi:hypothetical protein
MEATMTASTSLPVATGVAAAIAALFLSGKAQAITDTVFKYSAPKTGWYTIHPSAMAPQHLNQPFDYYIGHENGELTVNNIRCFQTGVNVPHLAKLTDLRVWYRASTTTQFGPMDFRLFRTAVGTGAGDQVGFKKAIIISGDRASEVIKLSGASATVLNNKFMYGFAVCMYVTNPNAAFAGARLTYTYTNAGD